MQLPNYENFTEKEIVVTPLGQRKAMTWNQIPEPVQKNIIHTMELIQLFRTAMGFPLLITNNWRPGDKPNTPHQAGKAVDIVPTHFFPGWTKKGRVWLQQQTTIKGFRLFHEWDPKGRPLEEYEGWFHFDRNYRDNGENQFWIGYFKNGKMNYALYDGKTPWEM